jgi:prepilin-type N-terminal cleavage/methylation domain-containing protein
MPLFSSNLRMDIQDCDHSSLRGNVRLPVGERGGFSLIEVLVSVGVIAILAAAGAGVVQHCTGKGKMIREISAGKNLINAYQMAAADGDGRYLPGMDYTVNKVWFEPEKREISTTHVANRYPYRLAPYFDYRLEGTILVNENKKQIDKIFAGPYGISTFPAFGINYYYVGGLVTGTGDVMLSDDCLTRTGHGLGSILVFASGGTGTVDGYNILTPPRIYGQNWSTSAWSENADPGNWGNVDARYEGKAVCVFLDGSIRMLSIDELKDMRLWSKNAAMTDDPNYSIK